MYAVTDSVWGLDHPNLVPVTGFRSHVYFDELSAPRASPVAIRGPSFSSTYPLPKIRLYGGCEGLGGHSEGGVAEV